MSGQDLNAMVQSQVARVLRRGSRDERFDQLRNRHFWSSYLFVPDVSTVAVPFIPAGQYDIFKTTPAQTGQGYPTNVPLTLRETNWLNSGRVPDNQNFVIAEVGVTIKRIPASDNAGGGGSDPNEPAFAPSNGIYANLPAAVKALLVDGAQLREIHPADSMAIAYGMVLEMQFLTNSVPLGLVADFSQSSGNYVTGVGAAGVTDTTSLIGDATNGVPAAAFRRKLEIPIMLQHGESMGMRLNVPRNIQLQASDGDGCIVHEVRVDWWAYESFAEKS